ncbi:unnamed protein product [Pleuronectes platessa]|uniref:HMG box domain-containing protein n=1 Tax=Pleuronectes platessa TaxID=8262 RepID=A0A9N7TQW0_PLEPL|nr:unnamed protein product [Pleuronectes platessa]
MLDETRNREMREVAWGAPPGWLEEPNNQSPPLDVRDWYPVNWSGFHAEQQPILPQPQFNNVPTAMHTRHLEVRLAPVGLFKGQMIYGAPGDRVPSPVNVHNSEKRKHESQQDEERPYIPKPPNAFMLFMKEQRPYVLATHKSTDSATVNMIIGRKWRALSENKRDKYYKEAKRLKQLHIQLYPDWSEKENYVRPKAEKGQEERPQGRLKEASSSLHDESIGHF